MLAPPPLFAEFPLKTTLINVDGPPTGMPPPLPAMFPVKTTFVSVDPR